MTFKPGQSGNLGGRSKIQAEFEKKCREFLAEKGYPALETMAHDKDVKVRMWALERMLNRAFGREKELIDINHSTESTASLEELTSELARTLGLGEGSGTRNSIPDQGNS